MNNLSDQWRRILDFIRSKGFITDWSFYPADRSVRFELTADGEKLAELLSQLIDPRAKEWQRLTPEDVIEILLFFINSQASEAGFAPIHFN